MEKEPLLTPNRSIVEGNKRESRKVSSFWPPASPPADKKSSFCSAFLLGTSSITTRKMETVDILPLLDQLDDDVDDVEEVLSSVLSKSLAETSQKLPVLDRAKFHIGIVYALETLIFCMGWVLIEDEYWLLTLSSLLEASWNRCHTAPSIQRNNKTEALLRKDWKCRKATGAAYYVPG